MIMGRFSTWLENSNPGEQYVYREGARLSLDRAGLEMPNIVYEARKAYADGHVELVQRRIAHAIKDKGLGRFQWIAVKRKSKKKPFFILPSNWFGGRP
jgi:hypothetical protein